jgi:hypothetical protein
MSLSPLIQPARKFLLKLVSRLTEVSFFIHLLFLASTGRSLNHAPARNISFSLAFRGAFDMF